MEANGNKLINKRTKLHYRVWKINQEIYNLRKVRDQLIRSALKKEK